MAGVMVEKRSRFWVPLSKGQLLARFRIASTKTGTAYKKARTALDRHRAADIPNEFFQIPTRSIMMK
jgi:hypothetical protein